MALEVLDRVGIVELILRAGAGLDLPDDIADRLAAGCDGTPRDALDRLWSTVDSGQLVPTPRGAVLDEPAPPVARPAGASLGTDARAVLAAAAVLAEPLSTEHAEPLDTVPAELLDTVPAELLDTVPAEALDTELVAAIAGTDPATAARVLTEALSVRVLEYRDGRLGYARPEVPEALLRTVPEPERRLAHQRAAQVLRGRAGCGYATAEHYLRGGAGAEPAHAFAACVAAGTAALADLAPRDAVRYLEFALTLPSTVATAAQRGPTADALAVVEARTLLAAAYRAASGQPPPSRGWRSTLRQTLARLQRRPRRRTR